MLPRDPAACASYHHAEPDLSIRADKNLLLGVGLSPLRLSSGIAYAAVMTAVRKVDHQADRQPDNEAQPVFSWQGKHQHQTTQNSEDRHNRTQGCAKRTAHFGMSAPHDQDSRADDHEREQGAYIHQFGQNP